MYRLIICLYLELKGFPSLALSLALHVVDSLISYVAMTCINGLGECM